MGWLLLLVGLFVPRLVLAALWLFTTFPDRAFAGWFFPLLGFFLLPYTTLAYLFSMVHGGGVQGWYVAILVAAVLLDFGVVGGSKAKKRD